MTPEQRQKISEATKLAMQRPDIKEKCGAVWRGKKLSEGHRKKISDGNRRRYEDPAEREKTRTAGLGRVFSIESRAKISAALIGRIGGMTGKKHRPETIEKMRLSAIRHAEERPKGCHCWTCKPQYPRGRTTIEVILLEALKSVFRDVISQKRFGRWRVDAYVPSRYLAFEADGDYWHRSERIKKRDVRKDIELKERFGVTVIRASETELMKLAVRG